MWTRVSTAVTATRLTPTYLFPLTSTWLIVTVGFAAQAQPSAHCAQRPGPAEAARMDSVTVTAAASIAQMPWNVAPPISDRTTVTEPASPTSMPFVPPRTATASTRTPV